MKIQAKNAPEFVRHLGIIAKLARTDHPYPFEIWEKLCRLEQQAHHITTMECNGDIQPDIAEIKLSKIEAKVKALLPNVRTLFINGDPRGYALKIKEEEAVELQMHRDWGGYGIIAPEY